MHPDEGYRRGLHLENTHSPLRASGNFSRHGGERIVAQFWGLLLGEVLLERRHGLQGCELDSETLLKVTNDDSAQLTDGHG